MKSLNLKVTGSQYLGNSIVYVDDKPVNLKRNEFKNLTCKYETEKDTVNLKVYRMLDVGGVWWFITQLFFFIISIFGLFDIHSKNRALGLEYECEVYLKEENNITLSCNPPRDNTQAFKVETDSQITELSNKFYIDQSAKKTFKKLLIAKIVTALAIIAVVITVLVVAL